MVFAGDCEPSTRTAEHSQDFTVINVTPQQIVTRMAAFEPAPFLVSDPAYIAAKGGANQDASAMHGLSAWLGESIIGIPEIEAFKKKACASHHLWW